MAVILKYGIACNKKNVRCGLPKTMDRAKKILLSLSEIAV